MRKSFSGALCALAFLFVSQVSAAQELNCTKYHTGKFVCKDSDHGDIHVKRRRTKQTHTGVDDITGRKFKIVYSLVWIDECTYELTIVRQKNFVKFPGGSSVRFMILETYDDSYMEVMPRYPHLDPQIFSLEK